MSHLPVNTFAFLFTDVEGSTRLWEADPEAMRAALGMHDALLREVCGRNGGTVFKTIGDAFCVAFADALSAVTAAVEAQRALAEHRHEGRDPLKVRMAVHIGEAETRDNDFFGRPLNRVARMLSAAHGGQIIVSHHAAEQIRPRLGDDVDFKPLGEHRLKDLERPERIFQIVAEGLREHFPPLRSLGIVSHNLPVQVTSFIGRERELADVKRRVLDSHLLTLTGAGGTGKTRLSMQAAAELFEEFPDGVWQVELATITDGALVDEAITTVLGVREEKERTLLSALSDFLSAKRVLLILDNCEQVVEACARLVAHLLRSCPRLRVLATSRFPLGIAGETTYFVPSLAVPENWRAVLQMENPADRVMEFEAVRLFADRASAVQPGFSITNDNAAAVARICWRLDGIPLAIELAAVRVRVLSPAQIASRLHDRFRLLTGGNRTALPHQQTLRALIDWSYDLLSEPERKLLRRLGIFARGRTLEAVEAVCQGDGVDEFEILDLLASLVGKSLVTVESDERQTTRYYITESVWDYARERLREAGEEAALCARHLVYYAQWVESHEPHLVTARQVGCLEELSAEHVNLRMALEWAAKPEGNTEDGLRLAGALVRYWEVRSHLNEGLELSRKLLQKADSREFPLARAKALSTAGRLAWALDDNDAALADYTEAMEIFAAHQNEAGRLGVLALSGFAVRSAGRSAESKPYFAESLEGAKRLGIDRLAAVAEAGLGSVALDEGDLAKARELKEQSMKFYRGSGDKWVISLAGWSLGRVLIALRDWEAAERCFRESLLVCEELKNEWELPYLLEGFGDIALGKGDAARAATLFGAAEVMREKFALRHAPGDLPAYQASVAALQSELPTGEFQSAWTRGRGLKRDEVLALLPVTH